MKLLENNPAVQSAGGRTSARELARIIRDRRIGLIPVVDEDACVVGVVSERDLVVRVLAAGKDPDAVTAEDIMTRNPVAADARDSWDAILEKMQNVEARHMLLTADDGLLVGVLSLRDFLRAHAEMRSTPECTDDPAKPVSPARILLDSWTCQTCGFVAFGSPHPEKCRHCQAADWVPASADA